MITTRNHLTMAELEASLDYLRNSPKDDGVLELIVVRPHVETREVLSEGQLDIQLGLIGDSWRSRGSRKHSGSPDPDMQLNIMNSRVVALVAQEKERWQLAGDQLFLNMDLSKANLPTGSRISIGSAVIEVTAPP